MNVLKVHNCSCFIMKNFCILLHRICGESGAYWCKQNRAIPAVSGVDACACGNRIIPRLQSEGPAAMNIWPGFEMHLVCKNAPEAGGHHHQVNDLLSVKHTATDQRPTTAHHNRQRSPPVRYFNLYLVNLLSVCSTLVKNGVHSPASVKMPKSEGKTKQNTHT